LNFIVRTYQNGDEKQIIPLLNLVYKEWPRVDLDCTSQERWEWLYLDNPEKINPTFVAEKDGQIIGVNHGLFLRVKVGKNVYLCLKGTDLAVHPNYRNKGINRKIDELQGKRNLELGICMDFYLTKNPIVINKNLSIGEKFFLAI
jgi:predicted N-acetyltransferase YhbS